MRLWQTGTKMDELALPEETVLEGLNKVSTAQRVANVQARSEGLHERADINKKKKLISQGVSSSKSKRLKKASDRVKKSAD